MRATHFSFLLSWVGISEQAAMAKRFWVYIMASKPWGTLYTGVTSDLEARVYQHREGLIEGFTKKYGVKLLVYFEEHGEAMIAIQREKRIKKWPRAWKINLIRTDNPDWKDLAADWYPKMPTPEQIENWVARTSRAMTGLGEEEDITGENSP
jgi:putative endonuclease